MNLYEVLGVGKDAKPDEIKRAYRSRARKAHPDRKGGDHRTMVALNTAYAVLSNPERRAHYDQHGTDTPLNSIEQLARQNLMQVMGHLIDNCSANQDIIEQLKAGMKSSKLHIKATLPSIQKKLEKLEKLRGEIDSGGGENMFATLFDQKAAALKNQIATEEQKLLVIEAAEKLIKDYRFTGIVTPSGNQVWGQFQAYQGSAPPW